MQFEIVLSISVLFDLLIGVRDQGMSSGQFSVKRVIFTIKGMLYDFYCIFHVFANK